MLMQAYFSYIFSYFYHKKMMRFIPLILFVSCSLPSEKFLSFGDEINASGVSGVDVLLSEVSEKEATFKIRGTVEEVCTKKGCWMTLKNNQGANIRITFKDYGFFVPMDIAGKEVIVEGVAQKELLDEEVARHYAEDGGQEYDEAMRSSVTFVAHGVLLADG